MTSSPLGETDRFGTESFLSYLADEHIISSAQLQLATEALGGWRHLHLHREGGGGDGQELLQPQQQHQACHEAARKRCCHNTSQPQSLGSSPPDGPLGQLPDDVLDHLMSLLATEPGGSPIRLTCRRLRSSFDRCNSRLVLREPALQAGLPPRLCKLLLCSPRITTLTLEGARWHRGSTLRAAWESLPPRLITLRFPGCDDIPAIAHCTTLHHLDLTHSTAGDLRPLSSCISLRHLILRGCHRILDLTPLASCSQLQHLDLSTCKHVQDLGPLASCLQLQHLSLSGCKHVQDLGPLGSCAQLQHLDLAACSLVEDISALAACVQLQSLDFSGCWRLEDIRPLAASGELGEPLSPGLPHTPPRNARRAAAPVGVRRAAAAVAGVVPASRGPRPLVPLRPAASPESWRSATQWRTSSPSLPAWSCSSLAWEDARCRTWAASPPAQSYSTCTCGETRSCRVWAHWRSARG